MVWMDGWVDVTVSCFWLGDAQIDDLHCDPLARWANVGSPTLAGHAPTAMSGSSQKGVYRRACLRATGTVYMTFRVLVMQANRPS